MISSVILFKVFIVGSSILSTLIPLMYVGIAQNKKKIIKNYEMFAPLIAIIFGVFAVIAYYIYKIVRKTMKNYVFLVIGGLLGTLLSTTGLSMNLPMKLFNFSYNNRLLAIPIATAVYSLIFEFIVKNLILFMI